MHWCRSRLLFTHETELLLQVCNKSFCFIALVNAIVKIWKYICMCYFLNLVTFFYIIKYLYIIHNSLATTAMIDLIRRFKASNKIILRATKKNWADIRIRSLCIKFSIKHFKEQSTYFHLSYTQCRNQDRRCTEC